MLFIMHRRPNVCMYGREQGKEKNPSLNVCMYMVVYVASPRFSFITNDVTADSPGQTVLNHGDHQS